MYTFKIGGVLPPEYKELSEHKKIVELSIPDLIYVSLSQHLGKPAKCLVKMKEEVKVGQLIGEASGFISANVHSPVSGIVKKVEKMASAGGTLDETVIIEVNHEQTADDYKQFETKNNIDLEKLDKSEIIAKIKDSGIVGMGGAAFPSNVKLSPPDLKAIDTLILNGAECEPYLTADHQLMLEKAEEILIGTEILSKVLEVEIAYIGIEENKPDSIKLFDNLIKEKGFKNIKTAPLKTKYPQGGEKQLIYAITKREVPSGKLPLDVGVVVHNVGTVYAVYETVFYNKPLIERIVTLTGFVNNPGNFKIKIGTPFSYVIENAGKGFKDETKVKAVINGGPMMGKAVRSLDVSVQKGTSGIVALDELNVFKREQGPCIRCGRCVDVCPMGLMPTELAKDSMKQEVNNLANSMDCIECGSCSYVCPTNRQLVHMIRIGKALFRNRSKK